MKLVVPLTMPRTRSMRLPARSDASGPRTGIPPPTAASNRSAAPVRRAIASSSGPWWAMTCLLAVTTALPIDSAAAIRVCAGSSPPISSTMTSMSSSATRCAGASDRIVPGIPEAAARPTSRTATAVSSRAAAIGRLQLPGTIDERAHDLPPDGSRAEHADAQPGAAHDGVRAGRDIGPNGSRPVGATAG